MNLFKEKKNYYEILGVSDSASQQEIESAYKRISQNLDLDASDENKKRFKEATQAYKILSDVSKRKKYDKKLFDDVDEFEYEEQVDKKGNSNKLNVYPKAKEVLNKNKYRLVAGGLVIAALVGGYKIGKETSKSSIADDAYYYNQDDDTVILPNDPEREYNNTIDDGKMDTTLELTAANIDEKVQEILEDNQSRGLNIDPTFIRSALFVTNIDYLDQEDIKKMWENNDLNIIEEIQNMYNYTSAVGTHNNNVALGQKEGKYIALSNLAYDEEDKKALRELDTEFVDLVNNLYDDMTSEEYQQSFKYITEFYTGVGYLTTNGAEYSNYSLTSGGGLLSEQYWPMFSVIYSNSKYLTNENAVDIKTLSYGTDGTDAVVNGSKYLGSIVNHESLQCLEDNQELETEKTLTKTQ